MNSCHPHRKTWDILTETQTRECARRLGRLISSGRTVFLQGPLGAGKTTVVREMLRALGTDETIASPTFALVYSYPFDDVTVHHFDLYRVDDPEELELIGIREYFDSSSCCLIEWPDRGEGLLPNADITIEISVNAVTDTKAALASGDRRRISVSVRADQPGLLEELHAL